MRRASNYSSAAAALARAERAWLQAMITRREPLARFEAALEHREHDVKTVIDLA